MKRRKDVGDFESLRTCTAVVVVRAFNGSTNAVEDDRAANGGVNTLGDYALDIWIPPMEHRHLFPRKMSCELKARPRNHVESIIVLRA